MKLRHYEQAAIECEFADWNGEFTSEPSRKIIFLLAGGPAAEYNCIGMVENMKRIYGGEWRARVVYRWRSKNHVLRWLKRGGSFKKRV